ncbi:MAG TPA: gamma-glutamyltransferase [Wenzhouxiangella sp.]|nr:gamma-glutamyltransferase [Wenzhouxiangella sp.]
MKRLLFALLGFSLFALCASAFATDRAAIASAHRLATDAGAQIIAEGGNVFDAAVTVSAVLSVVEPESSGLGGGGFWLLHNAADNRSVMVDGRETAPAQARRDMYLDDSGEVVRDRAVNGALAGGIPGLVASWVHIVENYGSLPLKKLLAPAIRLAEEGFPADKKYHQLLQSRADVMRRWPETAAIFLPDDQVPEVGQTVRNPDLGKTLRAVAEDGAAGFYSGEVAKKLVDGVRAAGGIWTLDDLADYRVVEREPVRLHYRGHELVTAPPPSSGGIAIGQILQMVSAFDLAAMNATDRVHLLAEAMRRAYRDRSLYMGDPDFVEIPSGRLLSEDYAAGLRTTLRMDRAMPSSMLAADAGQVMEESSDTTHFSLIDASGNMVATTQTVNLPFGSAFVPPGTGVLVNNEMDDFSAKPGEPNAYGLIGFAANAIEPGKRMLSSMSPTFVMGDERTAVIGTPGGSRIITMVLLGVLDFIDGNGPQSWVSLPRFHHQYLPDEISAEPEALSDDVIGQLEDRGHKVSVRSSTWGNMHGVMLDRVSGQLEAASDPRWESGAAVVISEEERTGSD